MQQVSESHSDRPVQISFFLDRTANESVHEASLLGSPGGLQDFLDTNDGRRPGEVPSLYGAISLIVNGEELLGPSLWIRFRGLPLVANLICNREPMLVTLDDSASKELAVTSHGAGSVQITVRAGYERKVEAPLAAFATEWLLLEVRLRRVEAALGAAAFGDDFGNVENWLVCDRLRELVPLAALTAALTEPLDLVLGS